MPSKQRSGRRRAAQDDGPADHHARLDEALDLLVDATVREDWSSAAEAAAVIAASAVKVNLAALASDAAAVGEQLAADRQSRLIKQRVLRLIGTWGRANPQRRSAG